MQRLSQIFILLCLTLLCLWPTSAPAQIEAAATAAPEMACTDGTQPGGALYRICLPTFGYNNELVVYAHGYVGPDEPLRIPLEADGLATAFNLQGYGFATTSYRTNGLAVLPAIQDMAELVTLYETEVGVPDRVLQVGISEGGLVAALGQEQSTRYAGTLAICGPIGSFQAQLDYIGDFRILFDYFFPGLLPGSPVQIPTTLIDDWNNHFDTVIEPVIIDPTNANAVAQLLTVANAPLDVDNRAATIETALSFNIIATNDAAALLGGNPYDNLTRTYVGSADDAALNLGVTRIAADAAARVAVRDYETTGALTGPLVALHTDADPLVPSWHPDRYFARVLVADELARLDIEIVDQYGHCTASAFEIQAAFSQLVDRVENPPSAISTWRNYQPALMVP